MFFFNRADRFLEVLVLIPALRDDDVAFYFTNVQKYTHRPTMVALVCNVFLLPVFRQITQSVPSLLPMGFDLILTSIHLPTLVSSVSYNTSAAISLFLSQSFSHPFLCNSHSSLGLRAPCLRILGFVLQQLFVAIYCYLIPRCFSLGRAVIFFFSSQQES